MTTVGKIMEYFENNEDIFNECIEGLDSWNGCLGDDRFYSMDELPEVFPCNTGKNTMDLLYRAYFGRDLDSWHYDGSGNKIYNSFNPNREYFSFDGYANLISSDYKDYSCYLCDDFVEALGKHRAHFFAIDNNVELSNLFDKLESED